MVVAAYEGGDDEHVWGDDIARRARVVVTLRSEGGRGLESEVLFNSGAQVSGAGGALWRLEDASQRLEVAGGDR